MTKTEINELVKRYYVKDGYVHPDSELTYFENSYDEKSRAICYSLIRHFEPRFCLEFGTFFGGSTCFIYSALIKNNKPFTFVASEKSPDHLKRSVDNVFQIFGSTPVFVGRIEENLNSVPEVLDFVFIDADHETELTHWYLENILPRCKDGALVAIHDWAVKEVGGKLVEGKHNLPEARLLMDLYNKGGLPLEKLYWGYEEREKSEASFWRYKK